MPPWSWISMVTRGAMVVTAGEVLLRFADAYIATRKSKNSESIIDKWLIGIAICAFGFFAERAIGVHTRAIKWLTDIGAEVPSYNFCEWIILLGSFYLIYPLYLIKYKALGITEGKFMIETVVRIFLIVSCLWLGWESNEQYHIWQNRNSFIEQNHAKG